MVWAEMRVERYVRWLGALLAVSLGALFVAWGLRKDPSTKALSPKALESLDVHLDNQLSPVRQRSLPVPLRDYCAWGEPSKVAEGSVASPRLVLRGLFVLHRHGDRSPILPLPDRPGVSTACGLRDAQASTDFIALKEVMAGSFGQRLRLSPRLQPFPRLPEAERCASGQLTAFGAVQLLRMGRRLRQAYGDFFDAPGLQTSLWTSPYARTFQSALALLAGLELPGPNVTLQRSPTTHFCRGKSCGCGRLDAFRRSFESQRHRRFVEGGAARVRHVVESVGGVVLAQPGLDDPLALFDTLMGAYVCRGVDLPCREGNCAVPSQVGALLEWHTLRMAGMAGERGGVLGKLAAAESAPILRELVAAGRTIQGEPVTGPRYFRYFSGHDVSVRPLLLSLGLYEGLIPHYGARIVLEVHQSVSSASVLIRVLYDGRDRTQDVVFCRGQLTKLDGQTLCPLRAFKAFLRDQLFQAQGASDLRELCAMSDV